MYAIIETGGKQYRVEKGDIIDVELLGQLDNGSKVEFKEVLFLNNGNKSIVGTPHIAQCLVNGEFIEQVKGPKVIAYKYKERKNVRKKVGHRQKYARVRITEIVE